MTQPSEQSGPSQFVATEYMTKINGIAGNGKVDSLNAEAGQAVTALIGKLKKYKETYNLCTERDLAQAWYLSEKLETGAGSPITPDIKNKALEALQSGAIPTKQKIQYAHSELEAALSKQAAQAKAAGNAKQAEAAQKALENIRKDRAEIDKNFENKNIDPVAACGKKGASNEVPKEIKDKIKAIAKADPKLKELGLTEQVLECVMKVESGGTGYNPSAYNTDAGGYGAQGLMQLRSSSVAEIEQNKVDKKWQDKVKQQREAQGKTPSARDLALKNLPPAEYKEYMAERNAAEAKAIAMMKEGLQLKEGLKTGNYPKDYVPIPGKGMFNIDTNLAYGIAYLKDRVSRYGGLEAGIKYYHGGSAKKNQAYYNEVKECIDAKTPKTTEQGGK